MKINRFFKAKSSDVLVGHCDITMPSGLVIWGCAIFSKNGEAWASPPGKPALSGDGTVQQSSDGKTRYRPVVSFADAGSRGRWSREVIAALRQKYPELLPPAAEAGRFAPRPGPSSGAPRKSRAPRR